MRTIHLLVLSALVGWLGCPPKRGSFVADPDRVKGLPSDVHEQIKLADAIVAQRPRTAREVDRALAALELALDNKPPSRFEVLWRAARACYLMSDALEKKEERVKYADRGRDYATEAVKLEAKRVEGHYYLAVSLGRKAEALGKLKEVKPILDAAQIAAKIDPKYDNGGVLCLMGKIYIMAPAWPVSAGSPEKAIEVLERAMKLAPTPLARLFLGEAYFHDEQYPKAKEHVERALREGKDLDARWRKEAEDYLRRIAKRTQP